MKVGNRIIVGKTRDYSLPGEPLVPDFGVVLEVEETLEGTRPVKVQMDSGATFWRPANYTDIGLRNEA